MDAQKTTCPQNSVSACPTGDHPWPEDPVPTKRIPCLSCPLATTGSRIVWGEGNKAADVWILLDNPGLREGRSGKPFVCGTRQTLHRTAAEHGYSEQDIYVTFVVRRRPTRRYPKDMERQMCMENFHKQLRPDGPRIVFAMGDVALSALMEAEAHVRDMRGRVHTWRDRILIATYHPLAVRRRPNLEKHWQEDWRLLQEL